MDDFIKTFKQSDINQKVKMIEDEIIKNNNIINNIIEINNKLEIKKNEIIKNNCINHKWITEREKGPYGEKFTFCKYCKISINQEKLHDK